MANKMLIDASHPEETRVVVLRGNRVEEFDFESASKKPLRGNIYLAKVTRVEPSLQAAFVEYGGNRHGFLAFSEIHPDYYQIPVADRQALLEEEQRQHKEDEEEEPRQRRSSRRRRGRNGQQRRARNGESVTGEAPAPEATSSEDETVPTADEATVEEATVSFSENGENLPFEPSAIDESVVDVAEAPAPAALAEPESLAVSEHAAFESTETPVADATPADAELSAPENESPETHAPEAHAQDGLQPAENGVEARTQNDETGVAAPADVNDGGGETLEKDDGNGNGGDEGDEEDDEDEDDEDDEDDENGDSDEDEDDDENDDDDDDDDEESEEDHVEQIGGEDVEELPVRATKSRRQYKIQEVIRRRQVLLVQVVKEERGNKGAALTTYLSLAGRYSVLMPNTARGGGISRKITDSDDRRRMKEIAQGLDVPEGMGVILRTAGASRSKQEVRRDFEHLLRMWESVRELTLQSTAPTLVYEEGSLIKRAVRDLYSDEIDDIVVAGDEGYKEARDYMRILMPSHARKINHWRENQPLFARTGVEAQLDSMFSSQVVLKSGGYIVINQTEALVAIDVNSGRSTREHNIEDTALRTNLEAADEVARQLRLRDLAGLIVVDFIDMEEHKNNRAVERRLKEALKNDRARIQVGRISHFGLLEMSRQRMRTGVLEGSSVICLHCNGAGTVRSTSSIALHILRVIEDALVRNAQFNLNVRTRSVVALYMLNQKRAHLREIEERFGVTVTVFADDTLQGSIYHVLERGELASAPPAAPRLGLVQIDSLALPEIEEEDDEVQVEDKSEDNAEGESEQEDGEDVHGADAQGENGRRRRRRRRRRTREPSGVDSDAPQPSDDALAAMVGIDGDFPLAAPVLGDGEVDEAEAEQEGDATLAGARVEGEPANGRRRRRSRRGGRRGERADGDDNAAQPELRSPFGSWVRSPDEGEPEVDGIAETVDLRSFTASPQEESAQEASAQESPVETAGEETSATQSNPADATPAAEASIESILVAEPKPEVVSAPEETPFDAARAHAIAAETPAPVAPAEPAVEMPAPPAAETPAAQEKLDSAREAAPTRAEPLPEAPAPTEKKIGWWQRAKSQLTGG